MELLDIEIEVNGKMRKTQWPLHLHCAAGIGVITPEGSILSVSRDVNSVGYTIISPAGEVKFAERDLDLEPHMIETLYWYMGGLIARYIRNFVLGDPEAEVEVFVFGGHFSAI